MRAWRYADRNGYDLGRCRKLGIHAQTARQVGPLFEQFIRIAKNEKLDVSERPVTNEAIQKCVLVGFSDHLACRLDVGTLRCALVHNRRGVLARESVVTAPLFVATEIAEVQGRELNVLLNLCTAINEDWLRELFPADFSETATVIYDTTMRRCFVERRRAFRDLVLQADRTEIVGQASRLSLPNRQSGETPDQLLSQAAEILAAEVFTGNLKLNNWDDAVEQWILRVNRLRDWMPDLNLPALTTNDRQILLQQFCLGAVGYKDIKDKPVWPVVKSWLSAQQQAWVDEYAPERIELSAKAPKPPRRAKVTYSADGPPKLAARIQDLYGTKSLTIAGGRVPVCIEILAPNQRPVQVTENLANFWRETYPKLKQELQRKYPKHEWR